MFAFLVKSARYCTFTAIHHPGQHPELMTSCRLGRDCVRYIGIMEKEMEATL